MTGVRAWSVLPAVRQADSQADRQPGWMDGWMDCEEGKTSLAAWFKAKHKTNYSPLFKLY